MLQRPPLSFFTDLEDAAAELDVDNAEAEGDEDGHEPGHKLESGLDELHGAQLSKGPDGSRMGGCVGKQSLLVTKAVGNKGCW